MEFSTIIGVDVSKLTLDVHVLPDHQYLRTENDPVGIKKMLSWLEKTCKVSLCESLFSFEYTGLYSYQLAVQLQSRSLMFVMLPGLELKRSCGITRGKSDQVDAEKIAEYTFLRRSKLQPMQLPENTILELKRLVSLRFKLVRQRAGFKATLRESRSVLAKSEGMVYCKIQEDMVKRLTLHIEQIESLMVVLAESDPVIKRQVELITSVQGVGTQTALVMVTITHGFQKFSTWRKFACYSGTAPFPYQSGTSIRGHTKVSPIANKRIKSVLSSIAVCAIRHNPELKAYYQKRLQEGKNKMSIQNIIRNKLIARIFAVVQRGTPYVNTMKFAS